MAKAKAKHQGHISELLCADVTRRACQHAQRQGMLGAQACLLRACAATRCQASEEVLVYNSHVGAVSEPPVQPIMVEHRLHEYSRIHLVHGGAGCLRRATSTAAPRCSRQKPQAPQRRTRRRPAPTTGCAGTCKTLARAALSSSFLECGDEDDRGHCDWLAHCCLPFRGPG